MKLSTLVLLSFVWTMAGRTPLQSASLDVLWTNYHPSSNVVSDVCFTPDGASVISGNFSGPARLWNVASGAFIREFVIPSDHVAAVAISPDGLRLAGGGGSGGFRIWSVNDGSVLWVSPTDRSGPGVQDVAFSPDGSRIARCSRSIGISNSTNLYEGILLDEVHSQGVRGLAFSPDGSLLGSSGTDERAGLSRVADGALLRRFSEEPGEHPGPIAFTPDGRYFIFGNKGQDGLPDGTATFWDLQTNGIARVFPGWGEAVRFTPDGKLLLTITIFQNGGTLRFWRVSDGRLLAEYNGLTGARSLDVSPDGKLFAYGGAALVLARMPLFFTEVSRAGHQLSLGWAGGSGLYQLQSTTNMIDGPWQNVGAPTASTAATNAVTGTIFYRVQSLPNP